MIKVFRLTVIAASLVCSNLAFSQGLILNGGATLTTEFGAGADTYLSNDTNSGPSVVHGGAGAMNIRAINDSKHQRLCISSLCFPQWYQQRPRLVGNQQGRRFPVGADPEPT